MTTRLDHGTRRIPGAHGRDRRGCFSIEHVHKLRFALLVLVVIVTRWLPAANAEG